MAGNQGKHIFGFYETPRWVAELVADNLVVERETQVIDLGAGKGSLLHAMSDRYPSSYRDAFEMNADHHEDLLATAHRIHDIDLLRKPIPDRILKANRQLIVVSNPPFGKLELTKASRALLLQTELIGADTIARNTRQEAVFLARMLSVAKKGSKAAFIVSSALLNNTYWRALRATLVEKHALSKIVLLPDNAFQAAEVSAVVMFMEPFAGRAGSITVEDYRQINVKSLRAPHEEIIAGYDGGISVEGTAGFLGRWLQEIYRGRSCSKKLKDSKIPHLHSSDIKCLHKQKVSFGKHSKNSAAMNENIALPGDILVARVGSRCLGSAVMLQSGEAVISDSVISVRVPKSKQEAVFKKLTSISGQEWLKNASTRACAKIITYRTLERFPLQIA